MHYGSFLLLVLLGVCICLTGLGHEVTGKVLPQTNEPCKPDKLTVYKVVLHTFWSRDKFPKHYPDWRPPAQWSKLVGEYIIFCFVFF